jgi:ABC-type polysaccharide/polyol phosphate export permease
MYLSPVLYDMRTFGNHDLWWFKYFRAFLAANPMTYLIALVRDPVYYGRVPDSFTVGVAAAGALASLLIGFAIFSRFESRHIHYL